MKYVKLQQLLVKNFVVAFCYINDIWPVNELDYELYNFAKELSKKDLC